MSPGRTITWCSTSGPVSAPGSWLVWVAWSGDADPSFAGLVSVVGGSVVEGSVVGGSVVEGSVVEGSVVGGSVVGGSVVEGSVVEGSVDESSGSGLVLTSTMVGALASDGLQAGRAIRPIASRPSASFLVPGRVRRPGSESLDRLLLLGWSLALPRSAISQKEMLLTHHRPRPRAAHHTRTTTRSSGVAGRTEGEIGPDRAASPAPKPSNAAIGPSREITGRMLRACLRGDEIML